MLELYKMIHFYFRNVLVLYFVEYIICETISIKTVEAPRILRFMKDKNGCSRWIISNNWQNWVVEDHTAQKNKSISEQINKTWSPSYPSSTWMNKIYILFYGLFKSVSYLRPSLRSWWKFQFWHGCSFIRINSWKWRFKLAVIIRNLIWNSTNSRKNKRHITYKSNRVKLASIHQSAARF